MKIGPFAIELMRVRRYVRLEIGWRRKFATMIAVAWWR